MEKGFALKYTSNCVIGGNWSTDPHLKSFMDESQFRQLDVLPI